MAEVVKKIAEITKGKLLSKRYTLDLPKEEQERLTLNMYPDGLRFDIESTRGKYLNIEELADIFSVHSTLSAARLYIPGKEEGYLEIAIRKKKKEDEKEIIIEDENKILTYEQKQEIIREAKKLGRYIIRIH